MTQRKSPAKKTLSAAALEREATKLRERAALLEMEAIRLSEPAKCQEAACAISARKGNVAVFLGAGASRTFGWPLTNQLLPIILDGIVENNLFEDVRRNSKTDNKKDRELLAAVLNALCPGIELTRTFLAKNESRLPLITSLLSMLDYSLSSGQSLVSGWSSEQIKTARMLLEQAIHETIEYSEKSIADHYWPPREPNRFSKQLVMWLDTIRRQPTSVGVITSNYDVAIEKAWGSKRKRMSRVDRLSQSLDFGFDWIWPSQTYPEKIIPRPAKPLRRLYKLHGSTNWLRCGLCDRVYIHPMMDITFIAYERKNTPLRSCHCGHGRMEAQIVSPSFVREMRGPNLISVWQRALNWLRKADDWIIIGYSFPDEDLNIRSLFTRALASRMHWPHVTAVQFGANEETRMRYETFFPARHLTFLKGGLEMFLGNALSAKQLKNCR
ncbi:MAG TPA: SIR2 family protein [Pyrinomonadaceae bacterium]|nr:SIR2 family protein [Pyrinomonadaceae bacterium]